MTTVFKKLPGVLSLNRCITATDALLFNQIEGGGTVPLNVMRAGMRGTQNINKVQDARREVSNIQVTDSAKTSADAIAMVATLAVTFHPLERGLNACALSKKDPEELLHEFRGSYQGFIERAKSSEGLREVGRRYARNIANGRWLWRNRKLAAAVSIDVVANGQTFQFDALAVPLHHFNDYSEAEQQLGDLVRAALAGEASFSISITATVDFGRGMNASVEVYPSQNYLGGDKPTGFARSLYYVGNSHASVGQSPEQQEVQAARVLGQAAIRDTKAANALRTFDTWYPEFANHGQPIAVEPAGANLEVQRFFRPGAASAFSLAKQLNTLDPDSDNGMFMIASLVRGGVYSERGDS